APPDLLAVLDIQTEQNAGGADGVDMIAGHGGRRSRTALEALIHLGGLVVIAGGARLPQVLSRFWVEAEDDFLLLLLGQRDELSLRHGHGAVAAGQVLLPEHRRPALRPRLPQSGLARDAVMIGAAPPGPVGRRQGIWQHAEPEQKER